MDRLTIDELIAHCNRSLDRLPSGNILYQEHESTRAYLQILRHYIKLGTLVKLGELVRAHSEGRCVVLPCKVGQTVYVISKCENVRMSRDDDYFTGTGAVECPFESTCDIENCNDGHIRIFETVVKDFWYGEENVDHPEVFLEDMGCGYMVSDFGKTVFLTREEAEAALSGVQHDGD